MDVVVISFFVAMVVASVVRNRMNKRFQARERALQFEVDQLEKIILKYGKESADQAEEESQSNDSK